MTSKAEKELELWNTVDSSALELLVVEGLKRGLSLKDVAKRLNMRIPQAKLFAGDYNANPLYPEGTTFNEQGVPIIPCDLNSRGDLQFYCRHCRHPHHHGAPPGHRLDHCFKKGSPLAKHGYYIVLRDKRISH